MMLEIEIGSHDGFFLSNLLEIEIGSHSYSDDGFFLSNLLEIEIGSHSYAPYSDDGLALILNFDG